MPEHSIPTVAEGLLEERYNSGLTALSLATEHPGRFTVDTMLGTIDDAWMVYGREAVADGGLVTWDDSPPVRRLRRQSDRDRGGDPRMGLVAGKLEVTGFEAEQIRPFGVEVHPRQRERRA